MIIGAVHGRAGHQQALQTACISSILPRCARLTMHISATAMAIPKFEVTRIWGEGENISGELVAAEDIIFSTR